jgi:CBS domain-containing protein
MPHGPRIAGEHATARVPVAPPEQTAGEVRDAMAVVGYDCVDDVAVLEGKPLVGIVPIEVLMAAAQDARLAELMDADPPVVTPVLDQESVAWAMVRKNESSVAVVDGAGEFVGLVPPHRMVGVLLTEHDEDVARLGGYSPAPSGRAAGLGVDSARVRQIQQRDRARASCRKSRKAEAAGVLSALFSARQASPPDSRIMAGETVTHVPDPVSGPGGGCRGSAPRRSRRQ